MRSHCITSIVAALGVVVPGCGRGVERAQADRPDLVGEYVYTAAGTTASVPWALRADLSLKNDSTYALVFGVRVKDEDTRETDGGSYAVEGDRLLLASSRDAHGPHQLRVEGDSLILETDWIATVGLRLAGVPRPVLVRGR